MKEENTNGIQVYAAINAVQNALKPGIPKDQKNAMQGYNFRGIDDIYNVVGPLLPEHGLLIIPKMKSRVCEEHKNAKGNTLFRVTVEADYHFVSKVDGSREIVTMYGEAMDSGDKATNKAMSAAYKYACIQTFSIPVRGEPDADSETHEVIAGTQPEPPLPSRPVNVPPRSPQREETTSGTEVWKGMIDHDKSKAEPLVSKNTNKPYIRYWIYMENGDKASTLKESTFAKIKGWDVLHEAAVKVRYNEQYKNWEWLDIEKVETPELEDWQQ